MRNQRHQVCIYAFCNSSRIEKFVNRLCSNLVRTNTVHGCSFSFSLRLREHWRASSFLFFFMVYQLHGFVHISASSHNGCQGRTSWREVLHLLTNNNMNICPFEICLRTLPVVALFLLAEWQRIH